MAGIRLTLSACLVLAGLTVPARAQTYPTKPIKLIVPFGAGGPVDVMGRLVAQKLSASVGAMIVENRLGQGGTLGSRAVAIADPDGYTLMVATSTTMGVSANLYKNLDFDPVKSFSPVALISSVPFVLVVRPSLPIKTVQELIAYAKANPGKLNFGFPTGTLPHLTGELFKLRTGIDVVFIPYKAANATITDLVAGQIDYTFEPASVLLGHINDGTMRPLAVTSLDPAAADPRRADLDESGFQGFTSVSWSGVVAPARTPAADRRKAQRRDQRRAQVRRNARHARPPRRRREGGHARGLRRLRRRRGAEMGGGDKVLRDEIGIGRRIRK